MYINKDINDNLDSLMGASTLKFGLNQGVKVVKIEYGATANSENINIQFEKEGVTTYGSIYKETGNMKPENVLATVKHLMRAFASDEQVEAALGEQIASFKELAEKAIGLISPKIGTTLVDLFLEYGLLKEGKTSAFLQMPTVRFNGKFICPATTMDFTEENTWSDDTGKTCKGLRYVSGTTIHPFVRYEKYMQSEATNNKKVGGNTATPATGNALQNINTEPKKSTW